MGRRSRKRMTDDTTTVAPSESTRAERDEARRVRAQQAARERARRGGDPDDPRLPAPWGPFPLTELVVLLAIGLLIAAFVVRGERGRTMLAAGLLLGSLGGLEVSIREHFAGYRSHTTMLAGAAFVLVTGLVFYVGNQILAAALGFGAVAFVVVFVLARRAFQRASGGLSYRIGGMRG